MGNLLILYFVIIKDVSKLAGQQQGKDNSSPTPKKTRDKPRANTSYNVYHVYDHYHEQITPSKQVSPMWVFESVAYLCKCYGVTRGKLK